MAIKVINNRCYLYLNAREGGKVRSRYVGPIGFDPEAIRGNTRL